MKKRKMSFLVGDAKSQRKAAFLRRIVHFSGSRALFVLANFFLDGGLDVVFQELLGRAGHHVQRPGLEHRLGHARAAALRARFLEEREKHRAVSERQARDRCAFLHVDLVVGVPRDGR